MRRVHLFSRRINVIFAAGKGWYLFTMGHSALLLDEPEARIFAEAIERESIRRCSAVTLLEASIVIEWRFG